MLFTSLTFFEIVMIQMIRRTYGLSAYDNKYLVAGLLAALAAHIIVLYVPAAATLFNVTPLTWQQIGFSAVATAIYTVLGTGVLDLLDAVYGERDKERIAS